QAPQSPKPTPISQVQVHQRTQQVAASQPPQPHHNEIERPHAPTPSQQPPAARQAISRIAHEQQSAVPLQKPIPIKPQPNAPQQSTISQKPGHVQTTQGATQLTTSKTTVTQAQNVNQANQQQNMRQGINSQSTAQQQQQTQQGQQFNTQQQQKQTSIQSNAATNQQQQGSQQQQQRFR
uniref:Uncharacterized protein n=1 Tax=Panagrolaimus sp. PS1159 TaxID=55785 RepID=A0AC35GWX9_9BILA